MCPYLRADCSRLSCEYANSEVRIPMDPQAEPIRSGYTRRCDYLNIQRTLEQTGSRRTTHFTFGACHDLHRTAAGRFIVQSWSSKLFRHYSAVVGTLALMTHEFFISFIASWTMN